MKEYEVTLPITGYCYMIVTASSEEEAIDIAFSNPIDDIESWTVHKKVVQGNIYHGEVNEASATELPE